MDDDIQTIEEKFNLIPEEVQSYVYSASFSANLETVMTEASFTQDQKKEFMATLYGYIATIETESDLITTLKKLVPIEEKRGSLIAWIKENVSKKILEIITNAYIDESEDENQNQIPSLEEAGQEKEDTETLPVEPVVAPSPKELLKGIQERLTAPAAIAPVQKEKPITKQPLTSEPTTKKEDPYREQVE